MCGSARMSLSERGPRSDEQRDRRSRCLSHLLVGERSGGSSARARSPREAGGARGRARPERLGQDDACCQCIGGFERLSAGSAHVLGTDVGRASSTTNGSFRAAKLGFLDQHYSHSLSPHLTCRRNVALQLELLGTERRGARERADALLERVGLLDRRADLPETLSGGEQQRVAVCAAIAHRPQLLLADEPVGELDAESAATIYELLADLVCEMGTTALVVSHDPASAAIADRVVTISDGRTVDERLPGEPTALVVSRGWIRVPESDLRALGRPSRLAVERHPRGLALSGVHDSPDGGGPAAVSRTESVPSGAPHDDPDPRLVAELRGVGKRYAAGTSARVVLDDTSASFRGGRLVAVVGRSGTGKTTLLRLLAGLERPNAGDVLLLGHSLAARTRSQLAALRREHVALVAQEPGLVPYLSAPENLRLNLRLRGLPPSDEAIEEALAAAGLDGRLATAQKRSRPASASESRSRARLPPGAISSSPTSRRRGSTGKTGMSSVGYFAVLPTSTDARSSARRTTQSSSSWPTR